MVVGAGLVGFTGFFLRNHRFTGILVGTLLYELVVNLSYAFVFGAASLLLAVPFVVTHVVSNLVFVGVGVGAWKAITRLRGRVEKMVGMEEEEMVMK